MKCPFCGHEESRVLDSRPSDDDRAIRRRRICEGCGKRFTTYERPEVFELMIVKKDNTRQPYDRQKLEKGILNAVHKRPVSVMQIKEMLDSIESELFSMGKEEIPSTVIGELVMKGLRQLDPVAYVRFASVYRRFKDVETFERELRSLKEEET